MVDKSIGAQKDILRPVDGNRQNDNFTIMLDKTILFTCYLSFVCSLGTIIESSDVGTDLPSLKYLFKVSLKLRELLTNTFLWLSRTCTERERGKEGRVKLFAVFAL